MEALTQQYSAFSPNADYNKWKDSFYESKLLFSLHHLTFVGDISNESILDALGKSIKICDCAGENSKNHFKQIYVFDKDSDSMHIDWMMSKTGFNLLILQIPSLNNKIAKWIWNLAEPQ
jgi:hypothetical protein